MKVELTLAHRKSRRGCLVDNVRSWCGSWGRRTANAKGSIVWRIGVALSVGTVCVHRILPNRDWDVLGARYRVL